MKKLIAGSALVTILGSGAIAADLPARGPAVAPAPVYAPVFTWSGFYVGLNAGVGFGNSDRRGVRAVALPGADADIVDAVDYVNLGLAAGDRRNDRTGFTGGAQIGYNWQFGSTVIGLEADINYFDRGRKSGGAYTLLGTDAYSGYELDVTAARGDSNWFGTIRPRIGVAFDRTLVYATGGLAYSGSNGSSGRGYAVLTDPAADDAIVAEWAGGRRSSSNWGWTLGAGVEHAFNNNWSVKLEYLYVDLDRGGNRRYISLDGAPYSNIVGVSRGDNSGFHVVRAGLNWRFGGGASAGPVVAAY